MIYLSTVKEWIFNMIQMSAQVKVLTLIISLKLSCHSLMKIWTRKINLSLDFSLSLRLGLYGASTSFSVIANCFIRFSTLICSSKTNLDNHRLNIFRQLSTWLITQEKASTRKIKQEAMFWLGQSQEERGWWQRKESS